MKSRWAKESGGVTAIVSILTASLLLYGTLALVVDGGIILLERRTVVNAAQSAALALARECIQNPNSCATSPQVQELANLNSPDQKTAVTEICVNGKTSSNTNCQGLTTSKLDCTDMTGKRFVRVRTKSLSNESGIGIRTFFSADASQTLIACSQVRIGNASSAPTYAPFAISICEWANQQVPGQGNPLRRIQEHKPSPQSNNLLPGEKVSDISCSLQGQTYSGISGWAAIDLTTVEPASARSNVKCPNPGNVNELPAYLRIGMKVGSITENTNSAAFCKSGNPPIKLEDKMPNWLNRILYIPLVSTTKGSSGQTPQTQGPYMHLIEAFTAFKLLGYSINGRANGSTLPTCPNNTNCIYGEFVSTFLSDAEIIDSTTFPNFGLQAIELS